MKVIYLLNNKIIVPFVLLFLLIPSSTLCQDKINFKAFGYIPNTIPDSLYQKLKNKTDTQAELNILYIIGKEHIRFGATDSILEYAKKMDSLLPFNKIKINEIKTKRLYAEGMYFSGLYDEALKFFIEGIEKSKNLPDDIETKWLKLGLGKVYLQKNEEDKALALFEECKKNTTNKPLKATINYYLGILKYRQQDYLKANYFFNKAEKLLNTKKSLKLILKINLYKGIIALEKEDTNKAIYIFEDVMTRSLANSYYDLYINTVLNFGRAYIKTGNYEDAKIILSTAYINAVQWNRLELQKKVINALRTVYSMKGDYKNAYNIMTQYVSISERVLNKQNTKVIKDLEYKYHTLEKEKEILQLKENQLIKENEINRQKTIKQAVLYGFLVLLIPILALLYMYYQKLQTQNQLNTQQKELNNRKIASLLSEQELKLAKTALGAQQEERTRIARELHDSIGGNLAGIKLQMSNFEGDLEKEIIYKVDETYELVRSISHDLIPKKIQENAFTLLINEYTENIKKNTDSAITFLTHPKEKVNNLPEKIKVQIYQITQELFTNTIKHAKAKNIELHFNIHNNVFQLLFEDDGIGFNTSEIYEGIGLTNIKNRIKQFNGSFIIDSTINRGTVTTIEIPLNKNYEKL